MNPFLFKTGILILAIVSFISVSNIEAQWQQANGPYFSEISSLAVKDSFIYAGSWYSGLYVSSNKGNSWQQKNNGMSAFFPFGFSRINTIEIISNCILLGTGEAGIFRSYDNGDSWDTARTGLPFMISIPDTEYFRIFDIVQSGPYTLAGTDLGVYLSTDTGSTWVPANGITNIEVDQFTIKNNVIYAASSYNGLYKSMDNGMNWSYFNNLPSQHIHNIISNTSSLFAVCDSSVFRSNDNGVSWQFLNTGTLTYIGSITCDNANVFIGTNYHGILYSPDNGNTWMYRNNNYSQMQVECLLINVNDIYTGSYAGIFYSNNNGLNWVNKNNGFEIWYSSTPDKIIFQSDKIWINTICGLYNSLSNGMSWEPANNGLEALSYNYFYDIANIGDTLILSLGNQGVRFSFDDGQNWVLRNNGLPCTNVRNISVGGSDIFIATDSCGLYRSSDCGLNWVSINTGLPSYYYIRALSASDSLVFCSFDNSSIVYKSINKGLTWMSMNLPTPVIDINICNNAIMMVVNGVKISVDYGQTWSEYNNPGYLDYSNGVTNGSEFYIGTQTNGVYKLKNNIWVPMVAGLPSYGNHGIIDLEIKDSTLWASVDYYGVWKRDISNININSYNGVVYNDINNDGNIDLSEDGLSNIMVKLKSSNYYFLSDSSGTFTAYADYDNDTLEVIAPGLYSTALPLNYIVDSSDTALNFGIHFVPGVKDLQITCTAYTPARPGFNDLIRITYKNVGTEIISGQVKFIYNDTLSIISSNPLYDFLNNDTITWNFVNLLPFENRNININFNVPVTLDFGDSLPFTSTVLPIIGDTVPNNNISSLSQFVTGSYDPNAKDVIPEGDITPMQVTAGEKLTYTIHFQNTGTDTAFTVKLVDTLSQNLSIPTFEILSASHNYSWNIEESGIIEFTFANILLPDSGANQLLSNGFIKYSLKPKSSLQCGDEINNTAHIYFDYNLPVPTNTTQTIVQWPLVISSVNNNITSIAMYPNPATNKINLSWSLKEKPLVSIFDISGQLLYQNPSESGSSMTVDVSSFTKGLYLVKVVGKDFVETRKLVIQ